MTHSESSPATPASDLDLNAFWAGVQAAIQNYGSSIEIKGGAVPTARSVALGTSGWSIRARLLEGGALARVSLYLDGKNGRANFDELWENREAIEADLGKLEWLSNDGKTTQACRLYALVRLSGNHSDIADAQQWFAMQVIAFYQRFAG